MIADWTPRCPDCADCAEPHPSLPDHWAALDWAESHKCERKAAA